MKRLLRLASKIKNIRNSRGKKLFLQTYIVMTLVRLGLLLLPFSRLNDSIGKAKQLNFLAFAPEEVNIDNIARAVYRSGRYQPGNPMCLARALTTAVLMNIYDFPHQINIGVAKSDSGIDAHAWIVSQGVVVVGDMPDLSRYVVMSAEGKGMTI